ncbi:MAG: 4-alpha-glucanotransferase, partial [Frankiales bacterium]|nr:4-alpha-glucanotransferase [Frankiales bacterium]
MLADQPGPGQDGLVAELDASLRDLAEAYDIATDYWDWQGRHILVRPETVIGVLGGLGVAASTPEAMARALDDLERLPWTRMLPTFLAIREGRTAAVAVHVADGERVDVWIDLESGEALHHLHQLENWASPRHIDGRWVGEASFEVPNDLPMGYHTLRARSRDQEAAMPLVVTPQWLGFPERMGSRRAWGLATQLYSVRSEQSWGVGDLVDLTDLGVWSCAQHGADFVLINPLHAAEPLPPLEPSPYLPTSRRFANPIYLRPERIPEYADLRRKRRAEIKALRAQLDPHSARIDRNAAWAAKRAALEIIFAVPRTPGRNASLAAYREREGRGLEDYARWCALAETYGTRFADWPESLRSARSPEVAAFAADHAREIDFHCWLQWLLDEQLGLAQAESVRAGMALGIMHDLAVGVHPGGADAWRLQDVYAQGVQVGAPPDPYNQLGQDWSQPPWRPDALAELGYQPFRDLIGAVLRHAGGVRVDHIIGMFRLWWIPTGRPAHEGTYVRYDHAALIGVLALEAHRAGAVVVGEDLGVVPPEARDFLRARGILGTSILWFEHGPDGGPLPAEAWREWCLASVTTHDLPPTAGYLAGDQVRLQHQ